MPSAQQTILSLATAAAAAAGLTVDRAYADGPFKLPTFSTSSPSPSPPAAAGPPPSQQGPTGQPPAGNEEPPRVRNDNPRTTAAGFDPEALERGAKALREINNSSQAKKVSFLFYFA
jgi:ATPase family AAA domain-containing protein 3A/B